MKSLATTFILSLYFCFSTIQAQGAMYDELNHYGQYFYDIDATATNVTAAGDNIILNSTDEGMSWQEIKLPHNRTAIKHVSRAADQHYVAAGKAIYITTNDGKDWIVQEEMDDIIAMENFDNTIIITRAEEEKRFMRSDDGGLSWATLSTSNAPDPQNLDYINTSDAFFTDATGTIYYSFNGGLSWAIINDNSFSEPIESLRFISRDEGYAQIDDLVWKTVDGGTTWVQIIDSFIASGGVYPLPSGLYTRSFSRFAFFADPSLNYILRDDNEDDVLVFDLAEANEKIYVSGSGMILINDLDDGFEEWDDLTPGPNNGFNLMEVKGELLVATGGHRMIISHDLMDTYQYVETSFTNLNDLSIAADGTIYITQNGLKKSVNDGQDWEFLASATTHVHAFDDGSLLTVGGNTLSKSTDGGLNFEVIYTFPPSAPRDLYFVDENFGWLLTAAGDSYKTQDGGATWETITFPFGSSPSKMHFIDSQIGYGIKTWSDKFWKTIDGGTTWEEIDFNSGEGDFVDVYFEDEMIGYVVGRVTTISEAVVYQTTDGGISWNVFHKGIDAFYGITHDEVKGKTWVCGNRAQLFSYSECDNLSPTLTLSNNRITCNESSEKYKWFLDGSFLVETTDPYIDFVAEGIYTVRIVGSDQCVSELSDGINAIVGTHDLITSSLSSVSPNPSNGIVNLNIDDRQHLESVSVYDLTGQLIHHELSASTSLDLSQLPSGSYFIRMQMQEGYSVHKIVIQ